MKVFISCFLLCWQAVHSNSVATQGFPVNSSTKSENTQSKISSPEFEGQPKRHFSFSQQFPRIRSRFSYPYPDHLYRVPRRQYRLEDFLWAGSGEGPIPEDNHDGMAWEDGLIQSSGASAIRITKTMVLYKTVLSTIYPIEMTPTVISSKFHVTPSLSSFTLESPVSLQPSPSLPSSSNQEDHQLTPSLNYESITPTPSIPTNLMSQTVIFPEETHTNSSGSLHDKLSSGSADLRYWVQTTIKAKREAGENPNDMRFQENMQRKLAKVYAEAFKRQFLKALTGERNQEETQLNSSRRLKNPSRQRRWSSSSLYTDNFEIDAIDIANPVYYSEINRMAKAAMNVTVTIMNIVWAQAANLIHIKYVVYAEGVPIPGFVAAKELNTVTLNEMEKEIGHEIVGSKAEALFQPSQSYAVGVSPTPWIVVLVVMVCIMFVILILTLFMAWKWKTNRSRNRQDHEEASPTHERQASPVPRYPAEDGGSPNSRLDREQTYSREGSLIREHRVSPSPHQPPARFPRSDEASQSYTRGDVLDDSPRSVTESSDQNTVLSDGRPSSSNLLVGPSGIRTSPQHYKSKGYGVSKKVTKKKKKKKKSEGLSPTDKYKPPSKVEGATGLQDQEIEEEDGFAMSTDVCTNMDKISFGNLDICNESLARTPSAHAKKVIDSRPSSHEQQTQSREKVRQPYESSAASALDDFRAELSFPEQDRDLSEKSFEITDSASMDVTSTRDAEAQTPTRLIRRSPRVRTSPKHRKHIKSPKMSQITSQSEEKIVFHDYNSSTEELNPLGRMRKRFHEFLDDAFSVMASGSKRDSAKEKGPQSAKVTVSHQVKTKAPGRPWTSHVIREESVRRVRPKSSVILGPPKSAWTAGSERRCQSAKSKSPVDEGHDNDELETQGDEFPSSARSTSTTPFQEKGRNSPTERSRSFLFPKYPTYPDVEICLENDPNRAAGPQSSHFTRSRLHPADPAVPLIEAIKDEMKRFERVKVSSSSSKAESTSAP